MVDRDSGPETIKNGIQANRQLTDELQKSSSEPAIGAQAIHDQFEFSADGRPVGARDGVHKSLWERVKRDRREDVGLHKQVISAPSLALPHGDVKDTPRSYNRS